MLNNVTCGIPFLLFYNNCLMTAMRGVAMSGVADPNYALLLQVQVDYVIALKNRTNH
jgi:hypothetical protein